MNKTKIKCDYCDKFFSTKSNLTNHQKTAKYCLEKQKKIVVKQYKCNCYKIFTTKINLERHKQICNVFQILLPYNETINILKNKNKNNLQQIEEKDKQIESKDKQIKELQNELASIARAAATKSTTTNINNKILNISSIDFNKDKIKNIFETKFDSNYAIDGQKGVAQFAVDNILRDKNGVLGYICTDPSRKIFKYKDNLGEIQKDVKAKKLTSILIEGGLKDINSKISEKWWTEDNGQTNNNKFIILLPKSTEITNITTDNTEFVNELSTITIV